MRTWQTSKIDWTKNDYFDATSYNRIVNNLLYLKELAEQIYAQFDYLGMEEQKNYYSLFYASEMNAIESNLETLNTKTYSYDIGNKKTYSTNGNTPDYEEFNRIEDAELKIFNSLFGQLSILPRFAITCGGVQYGKRVKYVKNEPIAYRLDYRLGTTKGGKF